MKLLKIVGITTGIIVFLFLAISITSSEEKTINKTTSTENVETNLDDKNIEKKTISEFFKIVDGKSYLANYSIEEKTITMIYNNTNIRNGKSNLSQANFDSYFLTGAKIDKILVEIPLRIFKDYNNYETINIIIEVDKTYKINITRQEVEKYLNIKLYKLAKKEWLEQIIHKYVYNKTNRENFINYFNQN